MTEEQRLQFLTQADRLLHSGDIEPGCRLIETALIDLDFFSCWTSTTALSEAEVKEYLMDFTAQNVLAVESCLTSSRGALWTIANPSEGCPVKVSLVIVIGIKTKAYLSIAFGARFAITYQSDDFKQLIGSTSWSRYNYPR